MFAFSLIATFFLAMHAVTALDDVTCFSEPSVIKISASTIVQPLFVAWRAGFQKRCPKASVIVEVDDSGAGAKLACSSTAGIDIYATSRDWKSTEALFSTSSFQYTCPIPIPIAASSRSSSRTSFRTGNQVTGAYDALVVVAHTALTNCLSGGLTVGQLRWIFSNYTDNQLTSTGWSSSELMGTTGTAKNWNRLFTACPNASIKLVGPVSSESHDFFLRKILIKNQNGEGFRSSVYTRVPENNIMSKVQSTVGGVGYLRFTTYNNQSSGLKALKIKNPSTGIYYLPSINTITTNLYKPLTMPLYMNVNSRSTGVVSSYIQYAFSSQGTADLLVAGFLPLTEEEKGTMRKRIGLPA